MSLEPSGPATALHLFGSKKACAMVQVVMVDSKGLSSIY